MVKTMTNAVRPLLRVKQMKTDLPAGPRAFTLIELLAVCAILAVLGLLALHNYNLAMVRSRVTAANASMRVVSLGLEMYAMENRTYPPVTGVGPHDAGRSVANPVSVRLIPLTTPVAWISAAFQDPFPPRSAWGATDMDPYDTFDYVDGSTLLEVGYGFTSNGKWRISSAGPDLYQSFGGRPANNRDANLTGVDYDATNGTNSVGDIVMVSPEPLEGRTQYSVHDPARPGIMRVPSYVEQWQ